MKQRIKKTVIIYALVTGVLLAYYVFVRLTGIGIPCIVHKITGLSCPGCGNSRALMALMHLDFKAAAGYNIFIYPELLFVGYLLICVTLKYIRTGKFSLRTPLEWLWIVFLAALIIWMIVRNIIGI